MPAPTNAQQAHNIQNLHGSWLVGATFKWVQLVGANFELVRSGFESGFKAFFSCFRIQTSKRQIQIGIRILLSVGFQYVFEEANQASTALVRIQTAQNLIDKCNRTLVRLVLVREWNESQTQERPFRFV